MAVSKKPRRKYRPKHHGPGWNPNAWASAIIGTQPLCDDQQRDLGIAYRGAFQALRLGAGTEETANTVACALNIALVLAERGHGAQFMDAIKAAQDGLLRVMPRNRTRTMTVAVLFARADSNYKALPDCDVWDAERDARRWPGGCPVVAHPPCRAWGRLRQFAKPREDEKGLALFAVDQVRKWGGVLEHPEGSTLWPTVGLPAPGKRDEYGGWTLPIFQHWWGHRAEKATLLYIVGCEPKDIPEMPMKIGKATHCIRPTKSYPRLPSVTKAEREHTPTALAEWLVELAAKCKGHN